MTLLIVFIGLVALIASVGLYVEYINKRKDQRRQEMQLRILIARLKARYMVQKQKDERISEN